MRTLSRYLSAVVLGAAALLTALLVISPGALAADSSPSSTPTSATSQDPATSDPGSDEDPTQITPDTASFGIGPALPVPETQVVDGRPYLDYRASAGATVRDAVALLNLSDKPVTLHVYATDAVQNTDGAFGLKAGDDTPTEAGSWFTLNLPKSGKVTVPPRDGNTYGRVEVPIEARIPANATPGDHVAGIVASLESISKDKKGTPVKFDQRIGIRAYFRLSGQFDPKLEIDNLHASFKPGVNALGRGTTTVTYDVHNSGNVRMNASQIVDVSGWLQGPHIERPASISDLLPGSTISVTQTFDDQFALGKMEALVSVIGRPVDPSVPADRSPVQARATFWALPWPLLAIVGGIILLIGLGAFVMWRHRRKGKRLSGLEHPKKGRKKRREGKGRNAGGKDHGKLEPVARIAGAVAVGLGALSISAPAGADVTQPAGGGIMLEPDHVTGDPARAIADGVWGHEGPGHDLGTYPSADITDGSGQVTDASQALWLKRFGVDDFNNVGIAFVKASKDGSAERPAVHKGENAGEAFEWFSGAVLATPLAGSTTPERDAVLVVHTLAEYEDWWRNGRPDQVFDDHLVAHDALEDGTPVSAHPQGKSIQNRWPSGTDISLVAFAYDGFDAEQVPILAADATGHAITSWLTFRTVADPGQPSLRTSAGYDVLSTSPLPKAPDEIPGATTGVDVGGATGDAKASAGDQTAGAHADTSTDGTHSDASTSPAGQDGSNASGDGDGSSSALSAEESTAASWTTLWTGSGWAFPLISLVVVVGVVIGATSLMRRGPDRP